MSMKRSVRYTKDDLSKIKALHEQGKSSQEIADIFGTRNSSMRQTMARLGLIDINNHIVRRRKEDEDIQRLVYRQRKIVLKKVKVGDKTYTDILPLITE